MLSGKKPVTKHHVLYGPTRKKRPEQSALKREKGHGCPGGEQLEGKSESLGKGTGFL